MRRQSRRSTRLFAAFGVLVIVTASSVFLYLRQGTPDALLARAGRIASVEATAVRADDGFTYTDLVLRSSSGLVVQARVRVPATIQGPLPAAVLVGGLKRGRRVAGVRGLDAIARNAIIVSPDYPLDPHRRAWRGSALIPSLARVRPAAFDAIASVPLLLDYLASRTDVRADALFLVGSSLGAPVVTIAGAIDERPRAVVVLYGGGKIGSLVAHTLAHDGERPLPPWQAWLAGHALAVWIAPLEPVRYVAGIAPRPLLLVNGSDDTMIPRRNVLALYDAAGVPKDLRWTAGEHVQPDEDVLIQRLADLVVEWLAQRAALPLARAVGNH